MTEFEAEVIEIVRAIPSGKVLPYGHVAAIAGKPNAARQISRILRKYSDDHKLAWHRVVASTGKISIPDTTGKCIQIELLHQDGVLVENHKIDLKKYLWIIE